MKIVYNINVELYLSEEEFFCSYLDKRKGNKLGEFLSVVKGCDGLQDYVYYLEEDGTIGKIEIEKCIILNEERNEKD